MSDTVPTPSPTAPSTGVGGTPSISTNIPPTGTTKAGVNVQSGEDPGDVLDREQEIQDQYEDLTVEELKDEIDSRNEDREDEDSHLVKSGNKADLIERLKEDDKRASSDPEAPAEVTGVAVVQEQRVGEGIVKTYSTGTDSPALRPFNEDPDYVNPADQQAAEEQEAQRASFEEAARREAPDADRLLRDFDPEGQKEDK